MPAKKTTEPTDAAKPAEPAPVKDTADLKASEQPSADAETNAPAAVTPPENKPNKNAGKKAPCLMVSTKNRKAYRRCGRSFEREPKVVLVDELSKEEIKRLTEDHNLIVREAETEAE